MTSDEWLKEVRLIAFLVDAALEDTFWELAVDEEEARADFEHGLTPGQAVRDAMLYRLVRRNRCLPSLEIHERLRQVKNL